MKRLIENFRKFLNESEYYYTINEKNPPPIKEIKRLWAEEGKKAYDPENEFHAFYSPKDLIPYREYDWSSIKKRISDEEWDSLKKSIGSGFDVSSPILVEIGANGKVKISEGNHRLAIANELGLEKVPVRFYFVQRVAFSRQSFKQTPTKKMSPREKKSKEISIKQANGSDEKIEKQMKDVIDLLRW